MTILVAALLFGVSGVVGVTVVTLASLSYAKHLDAPDADADPCPALAEFRFSDTKTLGRYRCEILAVGHEGPHKTDDPRAHHRGEKYWWNDGDPPDGEGS